MSLLNKASLIQIPSGYKDTKLFSAKPTNGDGDFTFSRGSNLAATRVNSDGLIEKGRENLLLQSNQFDTTWSPSSSITVTGGQSGYDGTNDAWLLKRSDANARYINQSLSLGQSVYTYSVYAKAESVDWLLIWTYDGSGSRSRYFDLANGVAGATVDGTIDVDIQSVGDGWYRCSITYDDSIVAVRLYPAVDDGSITGGISPAGVYIQDAQIEAGLIATDYIETGASTAQAGILEDMPRLDYSGDCPSCLLEPQRTNVVTQSEALSLISTTNSTITQNENVSPEGNQNGSLWTADVVTNGTVECQEQYSTTSGTTYTESWFVKYRSQQFVQLVTTSATFGAKYGNFDLINGTKGDGNFTDFSIEEYANDWYRISATETATSTGTGRLGGLRFISSLTAPRGGTVTTDGSESIEIYGHQAEAGSYVSSYIPTYASSVTRAYDYADNAGDASVFNDTEGVLYLESSWLSNALGTSTIAISDGTTSNRIIIGYIGIDDDLYCTSIGGGSSPSLMRYDVGDITTNHKIAIKYKANDFAFWVDGVERGTQSSGTTPVGLSELSFSSGAGGSNIYGNAKQILYFPTALTNDELATLTTI